ncbi:MAG: glycosyltransferase family 4 protein [bacterium]|nr:glycosyltransferase family 4 protein [bacterium]
MKILIAAGIYPPDVGGPATYSKFIEEEFKKLGHEVEVLVFSRLLHFPKFLRHLIYFWKILKTVQNFDVILTTDTISAGLPAHLAAFLARRPYVLKIGGDYVWEQGVQRWGVKELLDDFLKKRYGFKVELMRKLQAHVAKSAAKVIAPSKYLASVAEKWGVKPEKISVIYNKIIPPALLSRREARGKLGVREDEIILFSFGRDVPWKGFQMLREIMLEIKKEFPKARLVAGEVSREERDLWLASADIFLQNTAYEGFPHQLLEAMVSGLPIITTSAGGIPEIVENEKNAILVPYNDRNALIRAIPRLIADSGLQRRLGRSARARAQEFLSRDIAGETLEILGEVLFSNS